MGVICRRDVHLEDCDLERINLSVHLALPWGREWFGGWRRRTSPGDHEGSPLRVARVGV